MLRFLICYLLFVCSIAEGQQINITAVGKLTSSLDRITAIGFSSDSELMAVGDRKGNVQLRETDGFKTLGNGKVKDDVILIEFLQDDNEILIVDASGHLSFFSKNNFALSHESDLNGIPEKASIDPEKQFLSYMTRDGKLNVFKLSANMLQSSIDISGRLKNALYLGYDRFGQQLVVMANDGTTLTCNPTSQKIVREVILRSDEFSGSASVMQSGASNKGSDLFVTGVQEVFIPKGGIQGGQPERRNSILAYDWDSSNEIKRIRVNNRVDQIVLGPGPSHIAYFTEKRFVVTLVDIDQGAEVSAVTLDEFPEVLQISQDDAYLAAGDKNGVVHLYSLERNSAPEIKIIRPSMNRNYGESIIQKSNLELEGVLSDGAKIKKITINGQAAEILPNGKFSGDIDLVPGKNKVRVVAEDYKSNTIFKDIYVTRNPELAVTSDHVRETHLNQKRVALVIGNANYEGAGLLNNTLNDAKSMGAALTGLGFEVTTILDGSYEDMKNAVYAFGDEIKDVDVSLFFYAGHGLEIEGVNYLVPVDAQIKSALDVKQKTIPLTGVLRTIEYANEDGLNMIILDACRNNPFPTGKRGGSGLAKSTPPGGTLIAYSTAPGNVASDGEGDNGLYTGELIKQMQQPQRIEDVFMRTRNSVEEISNGAQQPWEEARLKGIFYLKID